MSLAAVLAAGPRTNAPRTRCRVDLVLSAVTGADLEALKGALDHDSPWTGAELAKMLQADGHVIQAGSIQRHRRGDCTCGTR